MKSKFLSGAALLFTGAVLTCVPAGATILTPGSSGAPDVLTETGTLVASITGSFSNSAFSGTYAAAVYTDPSNPFCAGCLDFLYQFKNNSTSTDGIARATAFNFKGFSTDVGFDPTFNLNAFTGTVAPGSVDRNSVGDTVGFNFPVSAEVLPGATSDVLQIDTNAKSFTTGALSEIDSDVSHETAFSPSVPEPASIALIGVGLVGLAIVRKRRSSR